MIVKAKRDKALENNCRVCQNNGSPLSIVLTREIPGKVAVLTSHGIRRRGVIHHALVSGAMNCAPTWLQS